MKNKQKYFLISVGVICIQTLYYSIGKMFANGGFVIDAKIDRMIPYISVFVLFYISWYFMLLIVPLLLSKYNEKDFYKYNICILINALISLIIFIVFPTSIPRYEITTNSIFDKLVRIIYYFDNPTTCLPSMHASAAFIAIYFSIGSRTLLKKYKIFIIIQSVLIILSTLFIKQHAVFDVIASFVISFIVYILVKKSVKD